LWLSESKGAFLPRQFSKAYNPPYP
jgi:hypothetical protein